MEKVAAKDGTQIAYDRFGRGPALIIVTGAFADRKAAGTTSPSRTSGRRRQPRIASCGCIALSRRSPPFAICLVFFRGRRK